MFKKRNFIGFLALSILGSGIAIAQEVPKAPIIEREVQIIANEDGGGYLGIQIKEVNKDNFGKFGLSSVRGVAVESVVENSPAKEAGVQNGDVIIKFDGEEITSVRKFMRMVGEVAPDHKVKLTVVRNGSEKEVTATVGKRPAPKFETTTFGGPMPRINGGIVEMRMPSMNRLPEEGEQIRGLRLMKKGEMPRAGEIEMFPSTANGDVFVWRSDSDGGNFVFGSTRQIGVGVSGLTKQLGDYFGVADGKGLLINNVAENSAAAKAGLKAGDVITEVEGKAISNTMDLIQGISQKKEGEVTLTIIRNKAKQTFKVTPEKMKEGEPGQFKITRSN